MELLHFTVLELAKYLKLFWDTSLHLVSTGEIIEFQFMKGLDAYEFNS